MSRCGHPTFIDTDKDEVLENKKKVIDNEPDIAGLDANAETPAKESTTADDSLTSAGGDVEKEKEKEENDTEKDA